MPRGPPGAASGPIRANWNRLLPAAGKAVASWQRAGEAAKDVAISRPHALPAASRAIPVVFSPGRGPRDQPAPIRALLLEGVSLAGMLLGDRLLAGLWMRRRVPVALSLGGGVPHERSHGSSVPWLGAVQVGHRRAVESPRASAYGRGALAAHTGVRRTDDHDVYCSNVLCSSGSRSTDDRSPAWRPVVAGAAAGAEAAVVAGRKVAALPAAAEVDPQAVVAVAAVVAVGEAVADAEAAVAVGGDPPTRLSMTTVS